MSKVAKQVIGALILMVVVLIAFSGFLSWKNKNLAQAKQFLDSQIVEFSAREKTQILKNKELQDRVAAVEQEKLALEKNMEKFAEVDVDGFTKKIAALTSERDDLTSKVEKFAEEREGLLEKLRTAAEEQVAYKDLDEAGDEVDGDIIAKTGDSPLIRSTIAEGMSNGDEIYWAQILKEKTSLELEVEELRTEVSQAKVQVTELKKANSDIQLELTGLANEKEEIERQIKYGKDLSDSLSLELARAQNDKKFLNDRLVKMNDESSSLREQIKQLTSTKIALEKSIVRLQEEKKDVQKKLTETENVIQGRIDEIWDIKNSLDESFGPAAKMNTQVELPPIVVSSNDMAGDEDPNVVSAPGINGSIVSVNNDNNFVIIDIGGDQGINLGDSLNVYRGVEYVAGLEIIQVRQDIAAADIISKVEDIKVGDAVR